MLVGLEASERTGARLAAFPGAVEARTWMNRFRSGAYGSCRRAAPVAESTKSMLRSFRWPDRQERVLGSHSRELRTLHPTELLRQSFQYSRGLGGVPSARWGYRRQSPAGRDGEDGRKVAP